MCNIEFYRCSLAYHRVCLKPDWQGVLNQQTVWLLLVCRLISLLLPGFSFSADWWGYPKVSKKDCLKFQYSKSRSSNPTNPTMINRLIRSALHCASSPGDSFWVGKELLESGFFVALGFAALGFDSDGIDDVHGLARRGRAVDNLHQVSDLIGLAAAVALKLPLNFV